MPKQTIPRPPVTSTVRPKPPEYAIWDQNNPHAVINLVPEVVCRLFLEAKEKFPKLFSMEEKELQKSLSNANLAPSATERRLRAAFWLEYESAVTNERKMNINAVYGAVCTYDIFVGMYTRAPSRVAWLLCPPTQYQTMVESLLYLGLDQLEKILELPIIDPEDPKRKVNIKLGELQAKIVAMLDMRARGGITQRIEQKSLNINVGSASKEIAGMTADELNRRIKELEKKEKKVMHLEHQDDVVEAELVPVEVKRGEN
jgi:hypothetical protein